MPFVAAQCTNCGGTLQVDDSNDAAICQYCGTPFIVEKAIQNYQIHNSYQIENANIIINDDKSFEKRIASAEEYLYHLKDYAAAYKIYNEIEEIAPNNYKIWYGKLCSKTLNFNVNKTVELLINRSIVYEELERDIDNAYKTVPNEERQAFHSKMHSFLNECKNQFQVKYADTNKMKQDADKDNKQLIGNINHLRASATASEKTITKTMQKLNILEQRGYNLKKFQSPALIIGVLFSGFMILTNSRLSITGVLTYALCALIPLFILFIIRMLVRNAYRNNQKKIARTRNAENQNYHTIAEHDSKVQENNRCIINLDNNLNVLNTHINSLNSILSKHNA